MKNDEAVIVSCSLPLFMMVSGNELVSASSEEGKEGLLLFKSGEDAQRYRRADPSIRHMRIYIIETPTQAMLLSRIADYLFLLDNEAVSVVPAEQFAQMFGMRDGQNRHRNRR